jgi:hypothetical protein
VKNLRKRCFAHCQSLSTVIIESDSELASIGGWVFVDCTSLSSICLPARLQKLNGSALEGTHLSQLSVANGSRSFKLCGAFLLDFEGVSIKRYFGNEAHVTIPNTIERLDAGCFAGVQTLAIVAFEPGSKLSCIGDHAFHNCSSLLSICLPSGLQQLGAFALAGTALNLSVEDGNNHFRICDDCLLDGESVSIERYFGSASAVTIQKTINRLNAGCFAGIPTIFVVRFEPDSRLSWIGDSAFAYSSLSTICIPSSVEKLGCKSFFGCWALQTAEFEPGSRLSLLEDDIFHDCVALYEIFIPASIEKLGKNCFSGCDSLSTVMFASGSRLLCIEDSAFGWCSGLELISIPASVERLCKRCFFGCGSLLLVTFESGSALVCVEEYTFAFCPYLQPICFPASVGTIPKSCFRNCLFLDGSVDLPG